ncbi:MAG TPA: mandelate racemase/muconate lactonizing enzyme family protein [Stellaceae bacterium]|nr:mandelate racemase/muconate lactonizing enzyme family protein [Stellaceae bacterium]HUC11932.1 mandelate racemase/muconate lactonizing enzyme family protein [Stellaceae bacterium]
MKISSIKSQILVLPEADPLANTPENPNAARPIVILRVGTDDGVEGIAVTFYGGAITAALKRAVDDLGALVIGEDPHRVEAIAAKLRAAAGGSGPAGMFTLALAALDIALWDIRGKTLGLPLWKLLGGARQRIATYASGALRRNLTLDQVLTAAGKLKDKGFREAKMQLALPGDTTPAREVERAVKIREVLGPDTKLMCDINQRWRPEQAIDIGKRVEDAGVGLFWLEDVTAHDDYAGLARVNAALATPICGGELVWGMVPFRHMIEARSVDYVMIDLARVGGITPWLKVAGMAEAFNLPVVSHVIPEIHAHLVAAAPNGLTVEYMGWMLKLFDGVAEFDSQSGEIVLSDRPGLGLDFNQATIDRYAAA